MDKQVRLMYKGCVSRKVMGETECCLSSAACSIAPTGPLSKVTQACRTVLSQALVF